MGTEGLFNTSAEDLSGNSFVCRYIFKSVHAVLDNDKIEDKFCRLRSPLCLTYIKLYRCSLSSMAQDVGDSIRFHVYIVSFTAPLHAAVGAAPLDTTIMWCEGYDTTQFGSRHKSSSCQGI